MIKMRVFNSYKQIKFSQVGIGGKPAILVGNMQRINEARASLVETLVNTPQDKLRVAAFDEATRRDSIFPSEIDNED